MEVVEGERVATEDELTRAAAAPSDINELLLTTSAPQFDGELSVLG